MEIYKRNLPYVLFIALGLKLLIQGANSLFDVLALLVLGLGLAFFELRPENKKFEELSNKINSLQQKQDHNQVLLGNLTKSMDSILNLQGIKKINGR